MHETFLRIGEELGDHNRRITSLEVSMGELLYWSRRAGLVLIMWALGIVSNYSTDQAAKLAADALKLLIEH
jgi:hypothetical protein